MGRFYLCGLLGVISVFSACSAASTSLSTRLATPLATQDDQNSLFDTEIDKIATLIRLLNSNEFVLPDVNWIIKTSGGILTDFSSWKRINDATVSQLDDGRTNIKGSIALSDMELNFDDFEMPFLFFFTVGGGSTRMIFSENRFDLDVTYGKGSRKKCEVQVNEFAMKKLGGFTIEFSRFTWLNWFVSKTVPLFTNLLTWEVVNVLGNHLDPFGKLTIGNANLC